VSYVSVAETNFSPSIWRELRDFFTGEGNPHPDEVAFGMV
jgi:hypothetical protein